jgi:hypothetical protein
MAAAGPDFLMEEDMGAIVPRECVELLGFDAASAC